MRRSESGFTLIEIMVVLTIIATLVAAVAVGIPMVQERNRRLSCQRNLSGLGTIYIGWQGENPGKVRYNGTTLLLHFRKKKLIEAGSESTLLCQGDQQVFFPKTKADSEAYDEINLDDPPHDRCSYAVRNFWKFPTKPGEREIFACDRQGEDGKTEHHQDGIAIVWTNGSAAFFDKEALGFGADQPVVVGPDSSNDDLKKVITFDGAGGGGSKKD